MEFIRFLAVNGVALTINVVVLRYAVVSLDFSPQVAQVGAIFLSLLTNFFGSKMIVYSY
jgi:putative flippase GtrA